jgi:DNA polymerase-3 subunit delta
VLVIGNIFNLFFKLMRVHFTNNKSNESLSQLLKIHPFAVKELLNASKIYPPKMISRNISFLYEYDLKSKGVDNSSFTKADLMKELIYKLMH